MSQDNLKDLFNDAFAAESIPFDDAGWQAMNKMLIAQRRRKIFGWFLASSITIAILVGSYFLIPTPESSYLPRVNDYSFQSSESELNNESINDIAVAAQVSLATVDSENEKLSRTYSRDIASNALPTESIIASTKQSAKWNPSFQKTDQTNELDAYMMSQLTQASENTSNLVENVESTKHNQISTPAVGSQNTSKNDHLDLMPSLALVSENQSLEFEDQVIPDVENKKSLNAYLTIGFSKTFDKPASLGFSRWGQRGGIGATYQLRDNLLLAAELSIARDIVNYEQITKRTDYGFSKYEFEQIVRVKEMLLAEVPILVYYRQNRLMVGSGIKIGYLLSSRIEEENNETLTIKDIGFANWKDLNSMRLSVPIDINYQLNDTYFVGCRYHFGLNDVFDRTSFVDRNNRFDLYLKMNLTR